MRKSFDDWMLEVENLLDDLVSVCSEDLPDFDYRGWYEDRRSAKSAVNTVLYEAGAFA